MKRIIPYGVFALLILLFLVSFSERDQTTPLIPQNGFHSSVINNAGCRACHTPGSQAPLKGTHVKKEECLSCHKPRKSIFGNS